MLHVRHSSIAVVLVGAAVFGAAAAEPEEIIRVTADDLASGKAVVIGRLGAPLETTVRIRGTWHRPEPLGKSFEPWFDVEEVDGNALDKPVRFHQAVVSVFKDYEDESDGKRLKPLDSETWELIARESGNFRAVPDPTKQQAIWDSGRFISKLSGVLRTAQTERHESEKAERLKGEKRRR